MTNKEVFEKLFNITIEQLKEMPQEEVTKWENEINEILWGGFNGENKQGYVPRQKKVDIAHTAGCDYWETLC